MAQYKRIFAALDGASTQDAVARRAASLARSYNANLMFGHVIDSVPYEAKDDDFKGHGIGTSVLYIFHIAQHWKLQRPSKSTTTKPLTFSK